MGDRRPKSPPTNVKRIDQSIYDMVKTVETRNTLNRVSNANVASCRTCDDSGLRPHCEGPTHSANATARTRSPRVNAALKVIDSSDVRFESAYKNAW